MRKSLFRSGLAVARADAWHGNVVLLQPLPLRLVSACVMLFAVATVVFLFQAHYTRRITAMGIVMPDSGLIKIQPPYNGIVLDRLVREGQQVRAGDVLYRISAETMYAPESGTASRIGATAAVLEQLRNRQVSIETDQRHSSEVERRERRDAQMKLANLQAEMAQLDQEIAIQQEALRSRTQVYERHAQAQSQGFLSPLGLQQKYEDLLDQKARVQALQRTRFGLAREVDMARAELNAAGERSALARSQLERQIAELQQDRVTREANKNTLITSPQDGVVAAVLAEPGQRVDRDTMLTVVPRESQLEVQVLLPSSAIGGMHTGDTVKVRFAAFPYQQFGAMSGRISEISTTAVSATAVANDLIGVAAPANADAYFRIRIALPSQRFRTTASTYDLRAGMKADVLFTQERRSLIEWLIAPVSALVTNA
jgi:membrane fusion protein